MKKLMSATLLSAGLLLGQCAWANSTTESLQENLFTIPLSAYQTDAKNPNQRLYLKPGTDLKQYQQVMIDLPMFLQQSHHQEWQLLQPTDANKIAMYFQTRLHAELESLGIKVVDQADENTLRVRFAVTGLAQARPDRKLTDFTPTKAKINLAKVVMGREPYLLMIQSMAQLEDAKSGELLAGVVSLKETNKTKIKTQAITLEYLQKEIDVLTKNSALKLAKAMGR